MEEVGHKRTQDGSSIHDEKRNKTDAEDDVFGSEQREFYMVKLFSQSAVPHLIAKKPKAMTEKETKTIISMVLSEMTELAQTIQPEKDKALEFVQGCLGVDVKEHKIPETEVKLIAEQSDAIVDAIVYLMDRLARNGVDGHEILKAVAKSNMKKGVKTENGWKFTVRESDNKIMKPDDFQPPNVEAIVQEMIDRASV